MAAVVFAAMLVVTIVAFLSGVGMAGRMEMRKALREAGFTKDSAKLYHRAAKILNRMVRVTELDGDFAADILSPLTEKQVNEWLADYRKQVSQ